MTGTVGIHWVVTTHGTWLHGDSRGSWRNGRLIGPDLILETSIQLTMREGAVTLSTEEIRLVATALGETCEQNDWPVYAAAIQRSHAHVVFGPLRSPLKKVVATLKYRTAATVMQHRRSRGVQTPRSLWASGRFARFLFDESELANAIEYVRAHNRRSGCEADPYSWITTPARYEPRRGERYARDT